MEMNKIYDESYYDFIIDNTLVPFYQSANTIIPMNERHSLIHIPVYDVDLCDLGKFPYHRFPSLFTLSSVTSIDASNISQVRGNPYLALFGQGVLVGIIDTGIDYQHPAFRDSAGMSRIYSLWDQTIDTENHPEGFTYGTEYTKQDINQAILADNPLEVVPSIDDNGHGTGIASIIAGTDSTTEGFIGVVPYSELAVVKLKKAKNNIKKIFAVEENRLCYQESDVIFAIKYLISLADRLKRPIAICIALGTSQGGHDGSGATSTYMTSLAQTTRVCFIAAAGNEASLRRHYYTNSPTQQAEFELEINEKDKMLSMEVWPYTPSRCAIEMISPTGETTKPIYPSLNDCRNIQFILNQTNVRVNNIIFEQETGDQMILVRFNNPTPGNWKIILTDLDDTDLSFHAWLPSGNLISRDTYFVESNPDTTITSPANARNVLTIAAYNQVNGGILRDSGRGYSRNGFINPEVAAPGSSIKCALPGGRYGSMTGTGAAAAHASGIAAMILEWAVVKGNYTSITGNDINRLVIRGAMQRDPNISYPNKIWGYGVIDAYGIFESLSIF